MQRFDGRADVGHLLAGRARRSLFDAELTGFHARVLGPDLAARRGGDDADEALGVAGEMRQDMADAPVRQPRRRRGVERTLGKERFEMVDEATMGGRATSDVLLEGPLTHRGATVAVRAPAPLAQAG